MEKKSSNGSSNEAQKKLKGGISKNEASAHFGDAFSLTWQQVELAVVISTH